VFVMSWVGINPV